MNFVQFYYILNTKHTYKLHARTHTHTERETKAMKLLITPSSNHHTHQMF